MSLAICLGSLSLYCMMDTYLSQHWGHLYKISNSTCKNAATNLEGTSTMLHCWLQTPIIYTENIHISHHCIAWTEYLKTPIWFEIFGWERSCWWSITKMLPCTRNKDPGERKGGGVCLYIHKSWCNDTKIMHCSSDVEYTTSKCRPF